MTLGVYNKHPNQPPFPLFRLMCPQHINNSSYTLVIKSNSNCWLGLGHYWYCSACTNQHNVTYFGPLVQKHLRPMPIYQPHPNLVIHIWGQICLKVKSDKGIYVYAILLCLLSDVETRTIGSLWLWPNNTSNHSNIHSISVTLFHFHDRHSLSFRSQLSIWCYSLYISRKRRLRLKLAKASSVPSISYLAICG